LMAREVMHLLTPVQQMIGASRDISQGSYDTPDVPVPRQDEMGQLADAFNRMKHSMAEQVNTLREKNEIERELHRQKTEALEMQNRMERSRLQQLRSQIDPHFLFNTLNVILQTAGIEKAYRTQALITALAHLLRYSLMSNDEQVPLSREVRIVDEYYSIYHVRFGDRIRMEWRISDSLDLTETMVPSFILQPIVENAFKHGISPKEEGGVVRIRVNPLREKGLLYISVCDNGVGIERARLEQLKNALAKPGERWEHIGVYNVAARLRLLDERSHLEICSHPGRGTAIRLYLPLIEPEEEDLDDDPIVDC
ncbi:MAG: sensor histidine kinase, partial [Dysosmobacter welbionis]